MLPGFRRAFCMASIRYRGTPEAPGLVLALDRDRSEACHGVAYRIAAAASAATVAYLRERELISYAYHEERQPVALDGGGVGRGDLLRQRPRARAVPRRPRASRSRPR